MDEHLLRRRPGIGLPVRSLAYSLCLLAVAAGTARSEAVSVELTRGDQRLVGDLYLPGGSALFPGVVLVHGSGGSDRNGPADYYRRTAEHFVRMGFAVLSLDKRGIGESSGDWRVMGFEDFAADAAAAVEYVQARPEVDARRVGMWGISQAGWILPLAARASDGLAFVVVVSAAGTGVTPGVQNLFDIRNQAVRNDLSVAAQDDVVAAWGLLYTLIRGGPESDRIALDAAVTRLREVEGTEGILPPLSTQVQWETRRQWFLALDLGFDAVPYWAQVRAPTLAIYGSTDLSTPVDTVLARFESRVARGRQSVTTVVIDGGSHTLTTGSLASGDYEFEPAYWRAVESWLSRVLKDG